MKDLVLVLAVLFIFGTFIATLMAIHCSGTFVP